jgi:uncharacterized protein (TIGR00299 family) protein
LRTLYLDCFSGIAGDMLVGALLDLGAPLDAVRDGLRALDLDGWEIAADEVERGAIRATKFSVRIAGHDADSPGHAAHQHGHGHPPARGLREIRALLDPAALPEPVKRHALAAFGALAEAEGRVHGQPADKVHFHEVGAVDAICDIVGAAIALHALGVERVHVGPVRAGAGFVKCAHGTLPVPAPATLECLAGFDVRMDDGRGELVTPTGACLLAALATPGAPATLRVERVGYGAGTRENTEVPNVLRAVLGDCPAQDADALVELRTNVDHLPPNVLAAGLDRVRDAGAVDVFTTPCTMKKGRSGHLVTALVPASRRADVEAALFRETGTLGVRAVSVTRTILDRSFESVATPWGGVQVKVGRHGARVTSREPELEDCRRLADEHGVPVADVVAAARRAAASVETERPS